MRCLAHGERGGTGYEGTLEYNPFGVHRPCARMLSKYAVQCVNELYGSRLLASWGIRRLSSRCSR
jgi:hypothetical protein